MSRTTPVFSTPGTVLRQAFVQVMTQVLAIEHEDRTAHVEQFAFHRIGQRAFASAHRPLNRTVAGCWPKRWARSSTDTWASLPWWVLLPWAKGWATIMPAPTVPLVRRSMMMNAPVVRLLS